jgi:murein DD-endopeptidase MepM/ murein hydrolase activator NlpD
MKEIIMKMKCVTASILVVVLIIMFPLMTFAEHKKHKSEKKKTQSFNKWESKTGNGNIISGSPYHKGPEVDIDGKKGDKVGAFRGGKVVYAGRKGAFGNTVIVKDKKGNLEQYSHLNSVNAGVGNKVHPNQKIGTIGNTGNVIAGSRGDGSHLHFQETNKKGVLIRPR